MSQIKIYSSTSQVEVMGIKNILESADINYQELSKQDSSYPWIYGEVQIYVSEADAEKAKQLVSSIKQ